MFVSEIRETRCRYAGAMSEISSHIELESQEIARKLYLEDRVNTIAKPVSYTHLTLPTKLEV